MAWIYVQWEIQAALWCVIAIQIIGKYIPYAQNPHPLAENAAKLTLPSTPQAIITDKELRFACWEFAQFATSAEFDYIAFSLPHGQSNSRAGAAVQRDVLKKKKGIVG